MLAGNQNQILYQNYINPQAKSNDFCFTIEGNIGCGKSTFLELLRQRIPQAKWIEQPVSDWQNLGGKNINMLELYYKQPNRWGFTFQIYAIFTRIKKLQQAYQKFPDKLKISERSILADKYVFSQLMKDNGYMNETQFQVFKSLYSSFQAMTSQQKTKIVYLRCTPQKCLQRTKSRQRSEQNTIPLEYLTKIHVKHQNWFNNYDSKRVLVIDTTQDFKEDQNKIVSMLNQLRDFINN